MREMSSEERMRRQRCMVAGNDVTGLLASQGVAGGQHFLKDVAVTDAGLHGLDTDLTHGEDQAEVTHDGHNECVVGESAAVAGIDGQRAHDLIAIDEVALTVNGQAAVRVAS